MIVASSTSASAVQRHDGRDRLTEPLVVDADDEAVGHAVDALGGLLDLLGEDLLAAGVDDLVAAAEQDQRAVGGDLGEVAGERVAHAVDDPERPRRLLRILEVSDRHEPAGGDHADLVGSGFDLAAVLGDDLGGRVAGELGGLGGDAAHRDLAADRALGRSDRVDQHQLGDPIEELFFHLGRPHHARRDDHLERRQVVRLAALGRLVERPDSSGLAIASPTSTINTARLSCGGAQHLVAVEAAAGERHHRATREVGDERIRATVPCRASAARSGSRSAGCRRR